MCADVNCSLTIGDQVVVESEGGPPEAEFALFDTASLELHSNEPGSIREFGYRSTAREARSRLEEAGVTLLLAEEAAAAMRGMLAQAYARGAAVRSVASMLEPAELFAGRVYDMALHTYLGAWLDLAVLAQDTKMPRATTALQALHLVSLLADTPDDAPVFLSTAAYTSERRPGVRTLRRVSLDHAVDLPDALRALAEKPVETVPEREFGPLRVEVLEAIEGRLVRATRETTREHLVAITRRLKAPEHVVPQGPLADPDLWELEGRLMRGDPTGVADRLDILERAAGRHPATVYLRSRLALLTKAESPEVTAGRAATLASSMSSFFELELLAAEAWKEAGNDRRARAFARNLVENPSAPDALRIRALDVLEAVGLNSMPARILRAAPSVEMPPPPPSAFRLPAAKAPPSTRVRRENISSSTRPAVSQSFEPASDPMRSPTPANEGFGSHRAETLMADNFDGPSDTLALVDGEMEDDAPDTEINPGRIVDVRTDPVPPPPRLPDLQRVPRESAWGMGVPDIARIVSLNPPTPVPLPPRLPSSVVSRRSTPPGDLDIPVAVPMFHGFPSEATTALALSRGASQPLVRTDPPPSFASASFPVPPSARPRETKRVIPAELAETLSLPPGLHGQPPPRDDVIPRTVMEARVAFVHMSRELGRFYKSHLGVALRTDVAGIEAMQHYLSERFQDGLRSQEDTVELKKHGAFLSEVLARAFGAQWIDILPTELGFWAMLVPPSSRVWPFGRMLRFVSMGRRERDLVSYYLELEARALRGGP
ncbi:MAG: hypothetical protein WCI05_04525 [Myxococcales bacterium]